MQKFRLYLKRLNDAASHSKDTKAMERYENVQALVSSGQLQLHPQTLAALVGRPIHNHMSGDYGVWVPANDNLGASAALNRPVSATTSMAVHGLSSSANLIQQCDGFNYIIRQGNGSNVDQESWNLERRRL